MSSTPLDSNATPDPSNESQPTPLAPPDAPGLDTSAPSSFENRHSKLENQAISDRRLAANRLNALHSTGPRSPEGKSRSSLNALTHGLRSRLDPQSLITDDEREQFTDFLADLRQALDPRNPLEDYLAERIALLAWQLRRAAQAQVHLLDATRHFQHRQAVAHNKQAQDAHELQVAYARPRDRHNVPPPDLRPLAGQSPAAHILYLLAQSGSATLNTLHRYQSAAERAFYQALTQYRLLHDPSPTSHDHHFHYHHHAKGSSQTVILPAPPPPRDKLPNEPTAP